jgi:thioredoxin-like negative regulator of GroEL
MAQLQRQTDLTRLHLLYFRPEAAGCTALDTTLFDLAAHHRHAVRLVVKHSDEEGALLGGWVSGSAPTVLFVRDGRTVAQFVGTPPRHEIEALLASALSCNVSGR